FETLRRASTTVVFFEAPHRIASTLTELAAVIGDRQISVGRELTKVHEESVRGPINDVLRQLEPARGEFTVVVDVGQSPDNDASSHGFEVDAGASRRRMLAAVAREHGLTANQLYAAIEEAKKSGK